ncbi:cell wall metabolism sensor histidine kinase WalK [Microaerobacter geothermalis]|uniref:two-component system histidine kinase PnpS n=1 Tax=Microaerobacter geothermalis TaxID=674972 RepID=UPI001F1E13D1|nr:sensor histidine kinase [Microaerobacter geothermalis]MCF6092962.1 cell wall metabolism sensor histidine kinase WalK [Microaerobacter geothermalis]
MKYLRNRMTLSFMVIIGTAFLLLGVYLAKLIENTYMSLQSENLIKELWRSLGVTLFIAFILTSIVIRKYAHSLTRPIEKMTVVAKRITENDYSLRVKKYPFKDEIGQLAQAINMMADSLQNHLTEINENEQQLNSILSNMESGVLFVKRGGRIQLVNDAAERILGVERKKMENRLHVEAIQSYELSQWIDTCLEEGERLRKEVHLYYPKERIFDVHFAPLYHDQSTIAGCVIVLHDITEIRHLEQMRSQFVANVSHELKTPITAIKGFAETLIDSETLDEETTRKFLQIIYDESERLNRLIKDILDLSKIEQRDFPLEITEVNITQIINDILDLMREEITQKKLKIVFDENSLLLEGDKDRLRQIFLNVISNAIVYTPEGGTIWIRFGNMEEHVEIEVKDTGIGIPKKDLSRIFERFYRVDKARSRSSGGTGLGLAIVKHLVDAHHGTIRVESAEGKGTSFFIMLPLVQRESKKQQQKN